MSEQELQQFYDTIMNGGKSSEENKNFDLNELKMGIKVEMEHIDQNSPFARDIAMKIARDHLTEFPDYYTRLKQMEQSAKIHKSYVVLKSLVDKRKRK